MARQAGLIGITGTFGELCLYEMEGKYYARSKSSLTGKRVKTDPKFKRTMQQAAIFGLANTVSTRFYNQLPAAEKGRKVRYELLRRVRKMIEAGLSCEEAWDLLVKEMAGEPMAKEPNATNHWHKKQRAPMTRRRLRKTCSYNEKMPQGVMKNRVLWLIDYPLQE